MPPPKPFPTILKILGPVSEAVGSGGGWLLPKPLWALAYFSKVETERKEFRVF